MNYEKKIYEYRYMDEIISKNRKNILKDYLINDNSNNLNFYELGMYMSNTDFVSKILSNINRSLVDQKIVLNKYQIELLDILETDNLFLSAPTSFGKTFIMLEYIMRNKYKLQNIVFIIPTLALMNELLKKIYNNFSAEYNICINASEELKEKNIFVFVPERCDNDFLTKISNLEISLIIFDEIYKLQAANSKEIKTDDRLIYMNKVYLSLINKAKKLVLLGPYINNVSFDKTNIDIVKYYTNFLPVYNDILMLDTNDDWINYTERQHQLIYFSSPGSIYKNIDKILNQIPIDQYYENQYGKEIEFLKNSISEKWYVIELLKRGIGIHHGKTPMFLRKFYENEYNSGNLKILLCTNTLMEGINTPTNSLIIIDSPGSSFKFNNLIGRVGRLNVKNPIIGEIIISSSTLIEDINDTSGWFDLKILAETNEIVLDDEVIYLNKEYNDEDKKKKLENKLELINNFGIDIEEVKNHNLSIDKCYDCVEKKVYEKLLIVNEIIDFVKIGLDIIKAPAYAFKTDKYKNLKTKYSYLPYKYYIVDLLLNKSYKDIVNNFNERFNLDGDISNVNIFIDSLYELNNFIKFKFSKFIEYIDLKKLESQKANIELNNFIGILSSYNSLETAFKILEDLGINDVDSKVILKYLNVPNITSTSTIIKLIRDNKNALLKQNLTPFTQNNIRNI